MGLNAGDLLIFKLRNIGTSQEAAKESQPSQNPPAEREMNASKEKIKKDEGIQSESCISHPWRPAYARCSTCNFSFCYADIMKYENKFYCLADIDLAIIKKGGKIEHKARNIFMYVSSILFLLNTSVLAYFLYPQILYVLSYLEAHLSNLIVNLNYSYYIPMIDLAAIIANFLAIFIVLNRSSIAFAFSIFTSFLSFILLSYEYLVSGASFLLPTTIFSLINMSTLIFSSMSGIRESEERREIPTIDWPNPEAF